MGQSSIAPFLTDLDSRAGVKGSVDPLGVMVIWIRLGRHVIGNLTGASSSARDFVTTILGYHFAERLATNDEGDGDLSVFIRWEQIAAYARGHINNDWSFRGTERTRRNIEEGQVRISADLSAQLLASQKTYGLWGLYSVPSRTSGLIDGDPARLTEPARRLVERVYLPTIERGGVTAVEVERRLKDKSRMLDVSSSKDGRFLRAIAAVWKQRMGADEREVLREHLLFGGPFDQTRGAQRALADAMEASLDDDTWALTTARIRALAKNTRTQGEAGERAAERLERIVVAEQLLAPSAALFDQLLVSNGQTVDEVAQRARTQWKRGVQTIDLDAVNELRPELVDSSDEPGSATRWLEIARCLASGDYREACELLLLQNAGVMHARSGAPWVEVRNHKLQARFIDLQATSLPKREELAEYWRNPYFLESLRSVAGVLREPK